MTSEYDQEIPQSHTADHHTSPLDYGYTTQFALLSRSLNFPIAAHRPLCLLHGVHGAPHVW